MAAVIKPARLRPKSTIGVVAPASPASSDRLEQGIRYLESLGYRIEVGRTLYRETGYLSGSDDERLDDLHEMFSRPDIDAIFCARGGYGTPRLLARIDYELIRRNPKIFVGYSDLTALQLAIFRQTGLVTFSGPMVAVEFANGIDARTEASLWRTLCEPVAPGALQPLQQAYQGLAMGTASGPLLGGCLSLLINLFGTPYLPDLQRAILLIEEIGEQPYRVDRHLAQLRNAGVLQQAAAVMLGQFIDCLPAEDRPSLSLEQIWQDYFAASPVPVIANVDYGHGAVKHTLPIGMRARVRAEPPSVEVLEAAVVETLT